MVSILRRIPVVLFACAMLGCESKLAGLTAEELRDRIYDCESTTSPGPGLAIACDNYRRECNRRRNAGEYVC